MTDHDIKIYCKGFSQLTTSELHDLLKLRVDVFVVEQACAYPELDGQDKDDQTVHALAVKNSDLIGYARALAPRDMQGAWRIGRVVVSSNHRRTGLARKLMLQLMDAGAAHWPNRPIELSAQAEVIAFYRALGFLETSEEYLEDGIPHVDMRRADPEI